VTISPTFFEAVGVRMLRGRPLSPSDGAPGAENIVVNERFAVEFFPGEDPIGKRIRFHEGNDKAPAPWRTIVGISPPIRYGTPQDSGPKAVA
jgi:hypothetical protein